MDPTRVNCQMEQQIVHFTGRVQGVGFRYSTRRIASGYRVTGYVRNLPDGRVELVTEGTQAELEKFINRIRQHMSAFISQCDIERRDATGEFEGFVVR